MQSKLVYGMYQHKPEPNALHMTRSHQKIWCPLVQGKSVTKEITYKRSQLHKTVQSLYSMAYHFQGVKSIPRINTKYRGTFRPGNSGPQLSWNIQNPSHTPTNQTLILKTLMTYKVSCFLLVYTFICVSWSLSCTGFHFEFNITELSLPTSEPTFLESLQYYF